jgi:hypothetical protein
MGLVASQARRSFRPPLLIGFPKGNQVFYAPEPICNASRHCRTHSQCTVNLDEIVGEIIESRRSSMVLWVGPSVHFSSHSRCTWQENT